MKSKAFSLWTIGVLGLMVAGCSDTHLIGATNVSKQDLGTSAHDVNIYKLNNLVCDPMGNSGSLGLGYGLKAELFYTNGTNYDAVQDYMDHGTKAEFDLFYSALNVPTRAFSLGFPTETGVMVKDDQGNDLVEYFGLRFNTHFQLGEADEPGVYEFAVLSDDGTIIRVRDGEGTARELVANDGDHPTRMGCSTSTLYVDHNSLIPMEIDYYQGPRYHISLVPLWRKVDEQRQAEPLCGRQGNSLFFDSTNNSKPQQAYLDLMNRGWKVWEPENFRLPAGAGFNPCVEGEMPLITEFTVIDSLDGEITVSWTTDIPSTAQVRIVDLGTGQETVTDSDNVLRTSHSQVIRGLVPGNEYSLQGISISDSYGKARSEEVFLVPLYN
ncbi:MAG: hypothetical protein H6626_02150 [Pseudobdellovibrionaceae bacterium]|nr:hypothetical protein [Bdellovibrionales bacterium]USN47914.1 MAG: hypothetical protein H6626_02150 [Pseudobdellovibrionaceae bacterium]